MSEALRLTGITKTYAEATTPLTVLDGAQLTISAGEIVALVGPSGSGKSTLLHIAGLLDHEYTGAVTIAGQDTRILDENARTHLRGRKIGFVYQYHHLLPEFTARENIMLPQMLIGTRANDAAVRADELLEAVGLTARAEHRPAQLSGGEQQRVAIARALANKPALLLADEPTGNLDPTIAGHVFDMLLHLARAENLAILMATHNPDLAARANRTVRLEGGKLV